MNFLANINALNKSDIKKIVKKSHNCHHTEIILISQIPPVGKLDMFGSYWRPWFSSDNPCSRVSLAAFKTSTEVSSCMLSSSLQKDVTPTREHISCLKLYAATEMVKTITSKLVVKDWPVVVQNPHEDVVHPLPANGWRMRNESRHGAQKLL